jgi:hypothetical protein
MTGEQYRHLRAARLGERLHEPSKTRAINNEVLDRETVPRRLGKPRRTGGDERPEVGTN